MKFLCDRMLGTLAKWLRIYGFDTFFATDETDDDELIDIAKKEHRVLITRDKDLIHISRRENLKVIKINYIEVKDQIKQVLKDTKIRKENVLTRCLVCNSLLENIDKKEVKDKIPPGAFQINDEFWICKKCNKIYWKGSHYDNMLEKINL